MKNPVTIQYPETESEVEVCRNRLDKLVVLNNPTPNESAMISVLTAIVVYEDIKHKL